jgi:enamine deaminase RidA (YjgF/YER057c/UK114 family)
MTTTAPTDTEAIVRSRRGHDDRIRMPRRVLDGQRPQACDLRMLAHDVLQPLVGELASARAYNAAAHAARDAQAQTSEEIDMARIPIAPPGMKDQRPRYTLGWRVGQTIYVAGQLPYDGQGNLVGLGDIKAQAQQALDNVRKVVEAGGGTMDDVVKLNVYVTDVRFREAYGEVRSKFFGPNPPASTLVQISNLALPGALIEIEAVAALDA